MAADPYDVLIVGARCAGAPLAALLARAGARVALVERASVPSDTLSSHLFEADALAFLDRLGVIEPLLATGAPLVNHTDTRVEDLRLAMALPQLPGDVGGMISVRRHLLDPLLAGAAEEAGAEVMTGLTVSGLLEDRGRVTGVRARGAGENGAGKSGEIQLRARLTVGADGRHSTIAKLCGARPYNVTPNRRLLYWAYFEGADPGPRPTFLSHRWDDRFILGIPSDSGLYQVLLWPEKDEREHFGADPQAAFLAHARTCEPIADALQSARPVGKVLGAVHWEGFFREAAGPGWVLSGDAGHFKSPSPGRGIGDAFLQADSLATARSPPRWRRLPAGARCGNPALVAGGVATGSSPSTTGSPTISKRPGPCRPCSWRSCAVCSAGGRRASSSTSSTTAYGPRAC